MAFSSSSRRCASEAASASVVASSVSAWATSSSLPMPPSSRLRTSRTCSWRKSTVPVDGGDFRVERSQCKIILRHVGLEREQHVVKIRQRRLRIGARALKKAAHAAPQIHFVAQVQRRAEGVGRDVAEAGIGVGRITCARKTRIQTQGWASTALRATRAVARAWSTRATAALSC